MSIAAALEANLRERIEQNLPQVSDLMVAATQQDCSRRTGALADSIMVDDWQNQGNRYTTTISAGRGLPDPNVARYQDQGTGLFGPAGVRITPRSAKVLVFDWPAAGGVVFARSVAGSPPTYFFSGPSGDAMSQRFSTALSTVFG